MRSIRLGLSIAVLVACVSGAADRPAAEAAAPATVGSLYADALAARERGDADAMLVALTEAERLAPDLPALVYGLACAHALAGHDDDALTSLERLAAMDVAAPAVDDDDLASLRDEARFAALIERFAATSRPVGRAERVATIEEREFLPEGVAYDPVSGDLFVGSVHREILRIRDGAVQGRVVGPADGVAAVLGMTVDRRRRLLWAATARLPQRRQGAHEGPAPAGALLALDLTGESPPRRILPADGDEIRLNDVAVGVDGTVYVSDSGTGSILRLAPGAETLDELLPAGTFRAPGGMAVSEDGGTLWVADWSRGLAAVALAGRRVRRVTGPDDVALAGIDGLVRDGGGLIAVQNGIRPHRVVRLELDDAGTRVVEASILSMNHPDHAEPTLGAIVADRFVYVANSQWERFPADGEVVEPGSLAPPVLLAVATRATPDASDDRRGGPSAGMMIVPCELEAARRACPPAPLEEGS